MVEEWVKDAHNQVKAEAYSNAETEKLLGALKQKHAELSENLK